MSPTLERPPDRPTVDIILGQLAPNLASTPAPAVAWEGEPVPLSARRLLPTFPLEVFPAWIADMVAAEAEFRQTPRDLAGCLALACLATAAGGRVQVEVRPGWREPTNLYVVVALPPGARKSPTFAAMMAPILHAQHAMQEAAKPLRARADIEQRAAQAQAQTMARAVESAYGSEHADKALAEAEAAATAAEHISVPAEPVLVADDITPEAVASRLAEQGGRLALLSAEGGIFDTIAGRYSGTPNLEVFLKGHAGDLLVVDRKGRDREYVEQPALTLGLAVQPDVLAAIADKPGFRGRGLLARILYSLPASTVGRRKIGTLPVPEPIGTTYGTNLGALVLTLADWTDPAVLPLTPDAHDAVLHLEELLEPRLHPDRGDLAPIVDWASKYIGATMRFAGLLHLATHRDALNRPITADTINHAARLGTYFLGHALATFDLMGADPLIDHARVALDWITRRDTFTRRELFTAICRGRFRKVTELDPVLDLLAAHGFIRPGPTPPATGGRPGSPPYEVHPRAAEAAQAAKAPHGGAR
jgi:replicative DNA helicase